MTVAPHALAVRWEERVMRSAHPLAYPLLKAAKKPVSRVPGVGVLVTDATLLRATLLDSEHFSKIGPGGSSELWNPVLGPSALLNMDGADHLALRRRLGTLFAPSYVDVLAAETLGTQMVELTERVRAGERIDLVSEVRRSASATVSRLVGLDVSVIDDDLFARVNAITGFVRLSRPRLTPPQLAIARAVFAELTEHAHAAYHAGDESTVPGRMRALGLSESEALGAVGAFALTGTETLVSYIPRLIALLVDSGWLPVVNEDRALLEPAIAEGLRVTTPSPVMIRSVIADTSIAGVEVRAGERVVLATFAANRALGPFDPGVNAATALRQLWFGAGSHFCIGAPLAMAQIRLTVTALLDSGDVRVVSRAPARGVLIPSYRSLVLERA